MKVAKLDDELIGRVEREFAQIVRSIPGFHAYRLIDSGNHSVASISFFEAEQGAHESIEKAREWIEANLAQLVDGPPTVFIGEQVFSELA
jgi:hypothetical protein